MNLNEQQTIRYETIATDLTGIPTDDPFDLYLGEVSYIPLLTAEEEVQLAKAIESGKIATEALANGNLSEDEYAKTEWLVELGDLARSQLASANMRLVISIAKKYRGRGIDLPDLVQEGNIGLMVAVDKFDYRRGNRFSTHATWWIRQTIGRSIANHSRLIRIPVNLQSTVGKIYGSRRRFLQEEGREPKLEELATILDMDIRRLGHLLSVSREPLRLQKMLNGEDQRELEMLVADEEATIPQEIISEKWLWESLYEAIDTQLPTREADIIRLYYGLHNKKTHTFQEIANMMGLSRERVRQLQKRAISKLAVYSA